MKFEFSAGGIVHKKQGTQLQILLCQHSQHHGWVFPKGLIGDQIANETKEQTALREVQEETGAIAKIQQPLTPVTYWYVWKDKKIKKTVYYYIMQFLSGDITQHDSEMEKVEWLLPQNVKKRLTYTADKKAWKEAQEYLIKLTQ